jgi:hypothetical protein
MAAASLVLLSGIFLGPAAAQPPAVELAGFPGYGRIEWKTELLTRGPVRIAKITHLPDQPVAKVVLELTRDLLTEEVLFLDGHLDLEAVKRGPISILLLDSDGVPLRAINGVYQGFPTNPRRGNRFRLIVPIPEELWMRTATVVLEWAVPSPPPIDLQLEHSSTPEP